MWLVVRFMSAILPVRSWLPVAMATGLVGCIYPQPREEGPDTATPPGAGPSIYDVVGGGVQDGNRVCLLYTSDAADE